MLHPSISAFLCAARLGSFSAAGHALHLSRVSVMNQINALEADLGVPLFCRSTQGVSLTPAGQVFLRHAEALSALADQARREVLEAGGQTAVIRMGASLMRPCSPFLAWWEHTAAPSTFQFQIVSFSDDTDSLSSMRAALGRSIDLFVTTWSSAPCPDGLSFLPLASCPCAAALPRNHPLAVKDCLTWDDLEGETLLLLREGASPEIDAIRRACRDYPGITILDFDGYYDMSVFNQCARQGWIMELPQIWAGMHPSLVTRRVCWPFQLPLGLMHRTDCPGAVRHFLEAVKKENEARPFRPPYPD